MLLFFCLHLIGVICIIYAEFFFFSFMRVLNSQMAKSIDFPRGMERVTPPICVWIALRVKPRKLEPNNASRRTLPCVQFRLL